MSIYKAVLLLKVEKLFQTLKTDLFERTLLDNFLKRNNFS